MQDVGNDDLLFRQDVVVLFAEVVDFQGQQYGEHTQRRDAADGKVNLGRNVIQESGER